MFRRIKNYISPPKYVGDVALSLESNIEDAQEVVPISLLETVETLDSDIVRSYLAQNSHQLSQEDLEQTLHSLRTRQEEAYHNEALREQLAFLIEIEYLLECYIEKSNPLLDEKEIETYSDLPRQYEHSSRKQWIEEISQLEREVSLDLGKANYVAKARLQERKERLYISQHESLHAFYESLHNLLHNILLAHRVQSAHAFNPIHPGFMSAFAGWLTGRNSRIPEKIANITHVVSIENNPVQLAEQIARKCTGYYEEQLHILTVSGAQCLAIWCVLKMVTHFEVQKIVNSNEQLKKTITDAVTHPGLTEAIVRQVFDNLELFFIDNKVQTQIEKRNGEHSYYQHILVGPAIKGYHPETGELSYYMLNKMSVLSWGYRFSRKIPDNELIYQYHNNPIKSWVPTIRKSPLMEREDFSWVDTHLMKEGIDDIALSAALRIGRAQQQHWQQLANYLEEYNKGEKKGIELVNQVVKNHHQQQTRLQEANENVIEIVSLQELKTLEKKLQEQYGQLKVSQDRIETIQDRQGRTQKQQENKLQKLFTVKHNLINFELEATEQFDALKETLVALVAGCENQVVVFQLLDNVQVQIDKLTAGALTHSEKTQVDVLIALLKPLRNNLQEQKKLSSDLTKLDNDLITFKDSLAEQIQAYQQGKQRHERLSRLRISAKHYQFYQQLSTKLGEWLIACKVLHSGRVQGANIDGSSVLSGLSAALGLVAPGFDVIPRLGNAILVHTRKQRREQENQVVSDLYLTIDELEKLAQDVAELITIRYQTLINKLTLGSGTDRASSCAAEYITRFIRKQGVSGFHYKTREDLVRALSLAPRLIDVKLGTGLRKGRGEKLKTEDNLKWNDAGFYKLPGMKVIEDGRIKYYVHEINRKLSKQEERKRKKQKIKDWFNRKKLHAREAIPLCASSLHAFLQENIGEITGILDLNPDSLKQMIEEIDEENLDEFLDSLGEKIAEIMPREREVYQDLDHTRSEKYDFMWAFPHEAIGMVAYKGDVEEVIIIDPSSFGQWHPEPVEAKEDGAQEEISLAETLLEERLDKVSQQYSEFVYMQSASDKEKEERISELTVENNELKEELKELRTKLTTDLDAVKKEVLSALEQTKQQALKLNTRELRVLSLFREHNGGKLCHEEKEYSHCDSHAPSQ